MKYDPYIIQSLLLKAANKVGVDLTHKHFVDISEAMFRASPASPPIPQKFLYESLYLKVSKAIQVGDEFIEVRREDYMNQLARFVGYSSYQEAWLALRRPIHPVLNSCEGNWYYYVRDSTGRDFVLRSPVKVWEENHEMQFALVGRYRWFQGEIRYKSGALFAVLFDEDGEKEIHLVFKVGIYRDPEILRGVFLGFSSEGIPVAGKVFLVRKEEPTFENLSIQKFNLQETPTNLSKSELSILEALRNFDGNYLRVTSLKGFDKMSMEESDE